MAHIGIDSFELKETGEEAIKSLPQSGKQSAVVSRKRETDNRRNQSDIRKMAHDFRASLNIIIGYAELLLDEVLGKINEEQRRSLSDILKYSKRMLHMVNDIDKPS